MRGSEQKAIEVMGIKPLNSFGSCFDAAAHNFYLMEALPPNARICHGLGTTNIPGEEGRPMAHAWIEFDSEEHGWVAFDGIWGIFIPAEKLRSDLQCTRTVEYGREAFRKLWKEHGYPGPFDPEMKKLTDEKDRMDAEK